jgi:hypothetical protein
MTLLYRNFEATEAKLKASELFSPTHPHKGIFIMADIKAFLFKIEIENCKNQQLQPRHNFQSTSPP